MKINRLLFMGSPDFALPTLAALYAEMPQNLVAIFSQPDKPAGRDLHIKEKPVKGWALQHNIPIFTPVNKAEFVILVEELNPDLIIVVAYGFFIPAKITKNYFCLNIHASLLPKFRGASPIQAALLNNEANTGISFMKINEKLDAGPILKQIAIPISAADNYQILHDKLAILSQENIVPFLREVLEKDNYTLLNQDEQKVSYCQKILAADLELNLEMEPAVFVGKVKAFSPKPGAYIIHNQKRYKILDAAISPSGTIEIRLLQPEGKRPMNYHDFLLGHERII